MKLSERGRNLQALLMTAHLEYETAVDALEKARTTMEEAEEAMESFWAEMDAQECTTPPVLQETPKRRGGRKPRSKNKPKEPSTVLVRDDSRMVSVDENVGYKFKGYAVPYGKQTDFKPETFANSTAPQEHLQVFNLFDPLPGETMIGLFEQYKWNKESRQHFIADQPDKSEHALICAFKRLMADTTAGENQL